jgi:DNA-binding Lrp family transcriptional regulator
MPLDNRLANGVFPTPTPSPQQEDEDPMSVRGYVLIESEVGRAKAVGEHIKDISRAEAKIVSVDTVTGPYDVIALIESDNLDHLGTFITDGIQKVDGVARTTTCLAVRLS